MPIHKPSLDTYYQTVLDNIKKYEFTNQKKFEYYLKTKETIDKRGVNRNKKAKLRADYGTVSDLVREKFDILDERLMSQREFCEIYNINIHTLGKQLMRERKIRNNNKQ